MSDSRNFGDASEHRVGDLLSGRVAPEDLDAELDAETISQLAAWFGAPAQGLPEGQPPARQTPEEKDPELRALWERRRRAMAAVDPELVDKLALWTETADEFLHLPEPLTLTVERPLEKLDLSVWKLRLFDVREWEIPEDLQDCVHERAPQAILRDLHRPVLSWPFFLQPVDVGIDAGGHERTSRLAQIIHARYQVRMKDHPIASLQARESFADLRAQLAEPWERLEIPEERRSRTSTARTTEDLRWFGDVGYDPDL